MCGVGGGESGGMRERERREKKATKVSKMESSELETKNEPQIFVMHKYISFIERAREREGERENERKIRARVRDSIKGEKGEREKRKKSGSKTNRFP